MPQLPHPRQIGRTGVQTHAMALGCYSMSNAYGNRSDAESIEVIRRAIRQGIHLIDTADFYGWGHNEELVAAALQGVARDQVIVSSKFGYVRAEGMALGLCSSPDYVKTACEASLKRLKLDYLDLYFQHRPDPRVPIEDTVGAMSDLVRQGKVRHVGLCEVSENTLRRAHAIHPVSAVQAEYSLWMRDPEQRLLSVLGELGISLMAFSPLARGMLSGQLRSLDQLGPDDVRRKYPRFSAENFPLNLALVEELGEMARALGCSTSQLSLAWLFHKSPGTIAICGCDTLRYLEENLGAMDVRPTAE